jgi:hypothetical protein
MPQLPTLSVTTSVSCVQPSLSPYSVWHAGRISYYCTEYSNDDSMMLQIIKKDSLAP